MRLALLTFVLPVLPVAFGCGGGGTQDGLQPPTDDATSDGSFDGDDAETTLDAGGCSSGLLCGPTGACCAVGEACVDGACTKPCPGDGIRCGAACCGTGELCFSGACRKPGAPCLDDVDCPPGEICEPTIGKCFPAPEGPDKCTLARAKGPFDPKLKWSWTGSTAMPGFDQAISAPLVADADGDGTPDVFVTVADQSLTQSAIGVVMLLDGKTGTEKWAASVDAFASGNRIETSFAPAVGELDGDGVLEVVALGTGHQLIAFDAKGKLKWKSKKKDGTAFAFPAYGVLYPSTIAIGDMDNDGKGEVLLSGVVFDSTGTVVSGDTRVYEGGIPFSTQHLTSSVLADADGDGTLDVVVGNAAYKKDGTTIWSKSTLADGFPGIADLDADGVPELVVVTPSGLRVQDLKTGNVRVTLDRGWGYPGPPMIADFDGDGRRDIAVQVNCEISGYRFNTVPDTLTVMWTTPMSSCSGFLTASAFDFDGDGKTEVLAHDDCYVRALDGSTGKEQKKIPASHATWTEFTSVADIDGDRSADLLLSANDRWNGSPYPFASVCKYASGESPRHGVFVYSDPEKRWMPTRRIWNEQSYHVTNVRGDGTLPKPEVASWGKGGFNTYRTAVQGKGSLLGPDLVISLAAALDKCPTLTLQATVKNKGSVGAPAGIDVRFFAVAPDGTRTPLGSGKTTKALLPGAFERIDLPVTTPPSRKFVADVDLGSGGLIPECVETNNEATLDDASCNRIK